MTHLLNPGRGSTLNQGLGSTSPRAFQILELAATAVVIAPCIAGTLGFSPEVFERNEEQS